MSTYQMKCPNPVCRVTINIESEPEAELQAQVAKLTEERNEAIRLGAEAGRIWRDMLPVLNALTAAAANYIAQPGKGATWKDLKNQIGAADIFLHERMGISRDLPPDFVAFVRAEVVKVCTCSDCKAVREARQ